MDYTSDLYFFIIEASVAFVFFIFFHFDYGVLRHDFVCQCRVYETAGRSCVCKPVDLFRVVACCLYPDFVIFFFVYNDVSYWAKNFGCTKFMFAQ